MASFQSKMGQEKSEKEKKSKLSFRFVPFRSYSMRNRKFRKNRKKIQNLKKYHYEFISSQSRLEKDEKERNKNYSSISFLPDAFYKIPKKIAKKLKKLKSTIMATLKAKLGRKRTRKREIKITVPFRSYPTCDRKLKKKQQKNFKNSKIPMWLH